MSKVTSNVFTTTEDSIYTSFTSVVSGIWLYLDLQNGVEPTTPYCRIFIVSETPVGMSSESVHVDNITRQTIMRQPYEALVRFVFVGKDKQSSGNNTNAANYAEDFA